MKSLREYITETEQTFDTPQVGDDFAIICREECLLETYVCDHTEDGIVLHADDKMMRALEAYGYLKEEELSPLSLEEDEHEHDVEIQDTGEYDHEGDMAKDDLATIVRAARRLTGMLDDNENMPEWVQSKITKAADYVDTAADYIESNKQRDQEQGVAEGEDDLVDLGPALRNLTGEFNKFMKHDDRMKTDPAYAKKWNKRYAKYAGNKDHNTYDDPDDDKEQGVAEGLADQWYVVPRDSLDYNGNYYGKGNDVSGPFPKAQAKAELHKAHPYDTNWTIVPAVALMNKGVAEGNNQNVVVKFSAKEYAAMSPEQKAAKQQEWQQLKQQAKKRLQNFTLVDTDKEQGVAEGSNPVGLQFDGKYYNKNGKLLGIWDGYVFTLMPEVERWWTKENGPEWVEQIKKKYTQQIQAQRGQQGMDEAKYQGREVPLGKPMKGDVKKSKVYVRGPKGNVVKVNFGQKGMKIKKNIPGRRKNFRARHNCDNPGPRWKARYWSCRAW